MQRYFQWFLIAAVIAGLTTPKLTFVPGHSTGVLVAIIVFLSFFTQQVTSSAVSLRKLLLVWGVQKIGVPAVLFLFLSCWDSSFALAVALMASLPAAGVSPTLIRMAGGDMARGLSVLALESVGACLGIPLLFYVLTIGTAAINPLTLSLSIAWIVFLPMVMARLIRKWVSADFLVTWSHQFGGFAVLTLALLVFLIINQVNQTLIKEGWHFLLLIAIAGGLALILLLLGMVTCLPVNREEAIAYGVKNMYVNIGLGATLALQEFGEATVLFVLAYMVPINLATKPAVVLVAWIFDHMPRSKLQSLKGER